MGIPRLQHPVRRGRKRIRLQPFRAHAIRTRRQPEAERPVVRSRDDLAGRVAHEVTARPVSKRRMDPRPCLQSLLGAFHRKRAAQRHFDSPIVVEDRPRLEDVERCGIDAHVVHEAFEDVFAVFRADREDGEVPVPTVDVEPHAVADRLGRRTFLDVHAAGRDGLSVDEERLEAFVRVAPDEDVMVPAGRRLVAPAHVVGLLVVAAQGADAVSVPAHLDVSGPGASVLHRQVEERARLLVADRTVRLLRPERDRAAVRAHVAVRPVDEPAPVRAREAERSAAEASAARNELDALHRHGLRLALREARNGRGFVKVGVEKKLRRTVFLMDLRKFRPRRAGQSVPLHRALAGRGQEHEAADVLDVLVQPLGAFENVTPRTEGQSETTAEAVLPLRRVFPADVPAQRGVLAAPFRQEQAVLPGEALALPILRDRIDRDVHRACRKRRARVDRHALVVDGDRDVPDQVGVRERTRPHHQVRHAGRVLDEDLLSLALDARSREAHGRHAVAAGLQDRRAADRQGESADKRDDRPNLPPPRHACSVLTASMVRAAGS